jgi:hypothetical protein
MVGGKAKREIKAFSSLNRLIEAPLSQDKITI